MSFPRALIIVSLITLVQAGCSSCHTNPSSSLRGPASASSHNWLFIGDSHSASSFGDGLREGVLKSGLVSDGRFFQFSVSGSSAAHWLSGSVMDLSIDYAYKIPGTEKVVHTGHPKAPVKDFRSLNDEIQPSTVIFAIGTNDTNIYSDILKRTEGAHYREPASISPDPLPNDLKHDLMGRPLWALRSLLNANKTARCALILPARVTSPHIPEADQKAFAKRMIQEGERRGCLIVNSQLIREPSNLNQKPMHWKDCINGDNSQHTIFPDRGDGIHFSHSKGEYWGHCVASFLTENWGD